MNPIRIDFPIKLQLISASTFIFGNFAPSASTYLQRCHSPSTTLHYLHRRSDSSPPGVALLQLQHPRLASLQDFTLMDKDAASCSHLLENLTITYRTLWVRIKIGPAVNQPRLSRAWIIVGSQGPLPSIPFIHSLVCQHNFLPLAITVSRI